MLCFFALFAPLASQNSSALNTHNLTSTSHLNISTGDLSSLTTQTSNKPRSRAPVVMSLPPIKSESIDINVDNEDYYAKISSPLNKSTEAQRVPIYENVPQNNSFNNGIYFNPNSLANALASQSHDYYNLISYDLILANQNLIFNQNLLTNH